MAWGRLRGIFRSGIGDADDAFQGGDAVSVGCDTLSVDCYGFRQLLESLGHLGSQGLYVGSHVGSHVAHIRAKSVDQNTQEGEKTGPQDSEDYFLHGHCPL